MNNALKFIVLGFYVKIITGFDDTITHVPVIASLAKKRIGKIAFALGMLSAIIVAITIAVFSSSLIKTIPYYRYITVILIFSLAICIYFDVFVHESRAKTRKKILKEVKGISFGRFCKLAGIGFFAAMATVLDDIIVYVSIFTANSFHMTAYAVSGIILATLFEIILVIFFSEKIAKIKYKEEIASIGLLTLGVLILFNVV